MSHLRIIQELGGVFRWVGQVKRRLLFERGVRMAMIPTTCYLGVLPLATGVENPGAQSWI